MSFIAWLYGLFSGRKTEEDEKRKDQLKIVRRPNYVRITRGFWDLDPFKHKIFCDLFENKEGFLFSYGGMEDEISSNEYMLIKKVTESCETYILHKACWTCEDLEELTSAWQPYWMRSGLDLNAISQMTAQDIEKFWGLIETWNSEEDSCSDIEVLGCLHDGYNIVWLNPSPEKVDPILEDLKKLAIEMCIEVEEA